MLLAASDGVAYMGRNIKTITLREGKRLIAYASLTAAFKYIEYFLILVDAIQLVGAVGILQDPAGAAGQSTGFFTQQRTEQTVRKLCDRRV